MKTKLLFIALLALVGLSTNALAAIGHATSITGVQGYDLVSYHTSEQPLRGSGHHVSVVDGVTYLFANQDNKAAFDRDPGRYLPAYGGYCAFGVSVGKKFVGDPEVWRVVDGKLYLNLDADIQEQWLQDVPGRIKSADAHWNTIKDKDPREL